MLHYFTSSKRHLSHHMIMRHDDGRRGDDKQAGLHFSTFRTSGLPGSKRLLVKIASVRRFLVS